MNLPRHAPVPSVADGGHRCVCPTAAEVEIVLPLRRVAVRLQQDLADALAGLHQAVGLGGVGSVSLPEDLAEFCGPLVGIVTV